MPLHLSLSLSLSLPLARNTKVRSSMYVHVHYTFFLSLVARRCVRVKGGATSTDRAQAQTDLELKTGTLHRPGHWHRHGHRYRHMHKYKHRHRLQHTHKHEHRHGQMVHISGHGMYRNTVHLRSTQRTPTNKNKGVYIPRARQGPTNRISCVAIIFIGGFHTFRHTGTLEIDI